LVVSSAMTPAQSGQGHSVPAAVFGQPPRPNAIAEQEKYVATGLLSAEEGAESAATLRMTGREDEQQQKQADETHRRTDVHLHVNLRLKTLDDVTCLRLVVLRYVDHLA
jgi:hypothetical protein